MVQWLARRAWLGAGRCRNSDGPHDGGAGASAARPRDLKFQQALRKP